MEYARADPKPDDPAAVEKVISYLEAMNSFFEMGLLGTKVRVFDPEGKTLQRMEKGFTFFRQWIEDLFSKGTLEQLGTTVK